MRSHMAEEVLEQTLKSRLRESVSPATRAMLRSRLRELQGTTTTQQSSHFDSKYDNKSSASTRSVGPGYSITTRSSSRTDRKEPRWSETRIEKTEPRWAETRELRFDDIEHARHSELWASRREVAEARNAMSSSRMAMDQELRVMAQTRHHEHDAELALGELERGRHSRDIQRQRWHENANRAAAGYIVEGERGVVDHQQRANMQWCSFTDTMTTTLDKEWERLRHAEAEAEAARAKIRAAEVEANGRMLRIAEVETRLQAAQEAKDTITKARNDELLALEEAKMAVEHRAAAEIDAIASQEQYGELQHSYAFDQGFTEPAIRDELGMGRYNAYGHYQPRDEFWSTLGACVTEAGYPL